jgi:hypothetical protein
VSRRADLRRAPYARPEHSVSCTPQSGSPGLSRYGVSMIAGGNVINGLSQVGLMDPMIP